MPTSARGHDQQVFTSSAFQMTAGGLYRPNSGGASLSGWTAQAITLGATHVFTMGGPSNVQHLDASGNDYDATPPGGSWDARYGTDSPVGVEVDWTSLGDAFDITTGPINENTFTVEAMVRTSSSSTTYMLGNDSGGGSTRPWSFAVTSGGELQAFANGQNGPVFSSSGASLNDGEWHHLVFSHDWTSGHTNHYIDGTQTLTDGAGQTTKQTNGTMTFLGVRPAQGMWDGDMAFCAFYGGVELTPAQVLTLHALTGV